MSARIPPADLDPFEPRFARHASGLLREFNLAGVVSAADVHVARQLTAMTGESDELTLLAVALAVRAPRLGHVHVNLNRIRETAAVDSDEPVDVGALDWPEPGPWVERVAGSELVGSAVAAPDPVRPLRLEGTWLYLDRYWAEEVEVARALRAMDATPADTVNDEVLEAGLGRLFGDDSTDRRQRLAAAAAVRQRFAVVAGGPGTGKTTTVARIVALLGEQALAAGRPLPLVALAAPTGKAAARLEEAVHAEAASLDVSPELQTRLLELPATTLHRLLGWRPRTNSRFRHNRNQRLPHDVVIVDETSMVSLSLMARLIEALRADARLVLVGDPGQLASIEAGAVLGDIVGPAGDQEPGGGEASFGAGIVVLERVHRFGGAIAELASAIRSGDDDAVIELLQSGRDDIEWLEADPTESDDMAPVRSRALQAARLVHDAAQAGDASGALAALADFRILCAHRRGPYGVASWTALIEGWLEAEVSGLSTEDRWNVGRPLLVTENDYELKLYNGDIGVVVQRGERALAAFERAGEVIEFSPSRLGAVDTVYAMTIHKSQGSQFDAAAVLLPEPGSRILTRELLYTAATRARRHLILVGTEEAIRAAVRRPVARASGLRWRLWGDPAA
jgi:exodeoxyribonuclease V alpha subunit